MNNQRNLITAMLLMGILLFGWDAAMRYYYPPAKKPVATAAMQAEKAAKPKFDGNLGSVADQAIVVKDLQTALAAGGRVSIVAPGLSGSINLAGGVIDDLVTLRHRANIAKDSGSERIFSPAGTPAQHFAQLGWVGADAANLPSANTVWTAPANSKLTPTTPVELSWSNNIGQTFTLRYTIDNDYLITVMQGVVNKGAAPLAFQPFALINRTNRTAAMDSYNIHTGPFGAFDSAVNFDVDYDDITEVGQIANAGKTDWIGFTDIYWMSVLIPDTVGATPTSGYRLISPSIFRADVIYPETIVAPGSQSLRVTRLFAGAKESTVLDRYEQSGIAKFDLAIDWGWFRWLEKPILVLLNKLFSATGNFGVAIILLTVLVRGIMFPIAQRQFASMAAMRAIQPKMKLLQDRYKDDKAKLQQETMELYKTEKVNPLAGCMPLIIQMPVFFGLYKVLMVAIEMRHQPFALWIKDLSAPDPLHFLNLFGLLPFEVPAILGLGFLGLFLGITMWLQFRMQPAMGDPAQQQVMAIMPWLMMFIMGSFASGLLIYWITTNVLVIAQQAYLYSRHPQLKAQADKDAVLDIRPTAGAK